MGCKRRGLTAALTDVWQAREIREQWRVAAQSLTETKNAQAGPAPLLGFSQDLKFPRVPLNSTVCEELLEASAGTVFLEELVAPSFDPPMILKVAIQIGSVRGRRVLSDQLAQSRSYV